MNQNQDHKTPLANSLFERCNTILDTHNEKPVKVASGYNQTATMGVKGRTSEDPKNNQATACSATNFAPPFSGWNDAQVLLYFTLPARTYVAVPEIASTATANPTSRCRSSRVDTTSENASNTKERTPCKTEDLTKFHTCALHKRINGALSNYSYAKYLCILSPESISVTNKLLPGTNVLTTSMHLVVSVHFCYGVVYTSST